MHCLRRSQALIIFAASAAHAAMLLSPEQLQRWRCLWDPQLCLTEPRAAAGSKGSCPEYRTLWTLINCCCDRRSPGASARRGRSSRSSAPGSQTSRGSGRSWRWWAPGWCSCGCAPHPHAAAPACTAAASLIGMLRCTGAWKAARLQRKQIRSALLSKTEPASETSALKMQRHCTVWIWLL